LKAKSKTGSLETRRPKIKPENQRESGKNRILSPCFPACLDQTARVWIPLPRDGKAKTPAAKTLAAKTPAAKMLA
jgi:hypothetical protein